MPTENLKSRHILSFAKRDSRITKGQREALDNVSRDYILPNNEAGCFDFVEIFQNTNPVVLEIGFGNGTSLLQQAIENPKLNFVGVEVYQSGVAKLLIGVEKHKLANIKILSVDAFLLLQEKLLPASISKVQLFFPDPWPKARHHKRRIVRELFLKLVHRALLNTGVLHIATDWENYADSILEEMAKVNLFTKISQEQALMIEKFDGLTRPTTKFEKRGLGLGHKIYEFYFLKTII